MNRFVLASCLWACFGLLAWGQEGPPRLSVSLAAERSWGGPGAGIETGLRGAGYDDAFYACLSDLCVGPTAHPYSAWSEDLGWTLTVRYLRDRRFGVSLLAARTPLQGTYGFKAEDPTRPSFLGDYADLTSEVTLVAALLTFGVADQAWVGIGPSVNLVKLHDLLGERSSTATTFGVVTEAGVRWPRASRVFLEVKGQYRWVASTESSLLGFAPPATLSASHATVTAGLGFRLGSRVGRGGS